MDKKILVNYYCNLEDQYLECRKKRKAIEVEQEKHKNEIIKVAIKRNGQEKNVIHTSSPLE